MTDEFSQDLIDKMVNSNYDGLEYAETITPEDFTYEVIFKKPPNYGVDVILTHIPTLLTVKRRGTNKERLLSECAKILVHIIQFGKVPIDSGMIVDYTEVE